MLQLFSRTAAADLDLDLLKGCSEGCSDLTDVLQASFAVRSSGLVAFRAVTELTVGVANKTCMTQTCRLCYNWAKKAFLERWFMRAIVLLLQMV